MAYEPFVDYSQLRNKNQFDNFGIGDTYGVENPFASPPPTFQDSGPMNPTQNTDYPLSNYQTQNSVFDRQAGGKEHPAVTDSYNRLKSIVDNIFTPSTQSSDRLNSLIDNQPQMNTPSFARKLAALGTGLGNIGPGFTSQGGGTDAMDRVLHAPYLQQMAAWKEKLAPAQAAATNESQRNIQERTLATNMMTAMTADDRNRVAQQNNDDKNEIARQRNSIMESKNNGYTYTKVGDDLIGHRPDGTKFNAGRASNFNDIELENLKQTGRMAVTNAEQAGANSRAAGNGLIEMNGILYKPSIGDDGRTILTAVGGAPKGDYTKVGGSGATKPNSLESNRERQDRMREIYERNGNEPNVTQFLHPDATNKGYTLEPRPVLGSKKTWGMFGGVTQKDLDTWDLIKQEVDPGYTVPPNPKGESAPSPTQQSQQSQQQTPPPVTSQTTREPSSPEDFTRQAIRQQMDYNKTQGIQDQIIQMSKQLNDPNFPNQLKGPLWDRIQSLQQQQQANTHYEVRVNPAAPNEQVRSPDGGKTTEFSYDGGKSWGPRR